MIGRRLILKGITAMAGDGLARPMNAPPGGNPVPGIQPGSQGVITANRVIIAGPNGQLLVYNGTPANGNLIASIAGAAGTDQFGNAYKAGITEYGAASSFVQLVNGALVLSDVGGQTWLINSSQSGLPRIELDSDQSVFVNSSGFVVAAAPGTPSTPEIWHTMSGFSNSWAASGNTPRYRLLPDGNVQLDGAMDATSATAAAFFTMPAGYAPASPTKLWAGGANGGVIAGQAPFIQAASTGVLSIGGVTLPTVGAHVTISGIYTLN